MGLGQLRLVLDVPVAVVHEPPVLPLALDLRPVLVHPRAHQQAETLLHGLLVKVHVGGDDSGRRQFGRSLGRRPLG